MKSACDRRTINSVVRKLTRQHGENAAADIRRGVTGCARVWPSSGVRGQSFAEFCTAQYVRPGKARKQLLRRLDEVHESVHGALNAAVKVATAGLHIANLPLTAADHLIGAYSPTSHVEEDYRDAGIGALAQLNFGTDDRTAPRTRHGWAERRMGEVGLEVVPAKLNAEYAAAEAAASTFISKYNLRVDNIDFGDPAARFPRGTSLVSHWGLRDYMMELYGQRDALGKQRALLSLLRRVADGEIPREMLDSSDVIWDLPGKKLRSSGRTTPARSHGPLRWSVFRDVWKVHKKMDPHRRFGNLIDNKFLGEREMTEENVVNLLTSILASPLAARAAKFLSDRLGRDLEPFDIYYRDFTSGGAEKSKLRFDIGKRYPTSEALHAAIPGILGKLGWQRDRAHWIASKIRVDNGRSAGHAWPPYTAHDLQLLRVRVGKKGINEIEFDTYMHELGHCVEGVLTSYEMDYNVLWGVPNVAFTEGFAFTFQDRTDEMLGRRRKPADDTLTVQRFWEPYEIAGSALTEIRFFHWLYEHPNATAAQMMRAVREIGDAVWAEFYAPIFGDEGHGLMSVYSHMLWGDFYLAEYPLGLIIAYQVRRHLGERPLAEEMERLCAAGRIYPDSWMKRAVGSDISTAPLLEDTERALTRLGY